MNDLLGIFTNPQEVFSAQKEDATWLKPAGITLIIAILAALVTLTQIDQTAAVNAVIEAQYDQMLESGVPEEQVEALRQQSQASEQMAMDMATGSPVMTFGLGILGVVFIFAIVLLIHSLYYLVVGKIINAEQDFSDWLAMCSWARLPAGVAGGIILALAALLISNNTDPNAFNVLSLAYYLDVPNKSHMFVGNLIWTLDILIIWSIALLTIGFKEFSGKDTVTSLIIAAAPYVVTYGILMIF